MRYCEASSSASSSASRSRARFEVCCGAACSFPTESRMPSRRPAPRFMRDIFEPRLLPRLAFWAVVQRPWLWSPLLWRQLGAASGRRDEGAALHCAVRACTVDGSWGAAASCAAVATPSGGSNAASRFDGSPQRSSIHDTCLSLSQGSQEHVIFDQLQISPGAAEAASAWLRRAASSTRPATCPPRGSSGGGRGEGGHSRREGESGRGASAYFWLGPGASSAAQHEDQTEEPGPEGVGILPSCIWNQATISRLD
eukprot:6198169-Pleurochrysis_carterae.AAC.1